MGTHRLERAILAIALSSIALASSLVGAVIVGAIAGVQVPALGPAHAAAITTPILAVHVAWRSLASDRPGASAIVRAIVAGIVNVPFALAVCGLAALVETRSVPDAGELVVVPFALAVAALVGAPIGGGLGLLYGIALSAIVPRVRDELAYRDLGAPVRTTIGCGVWLLGVASVCTLAAAWDLGGAAESALVLGAWGGGLTIAGTVVRARRLRRLARIARGEVPGWAIVLRESVEAGDDLPLLERGLVGDRVLVRVAEAGEGAYRGATTHEAVALLPDRRR